MSSKINAISRTIIIIHSMFLNFCGVVKFIMFLSNKGNIRRIVFPPKKRKDYPLAFGWWLFKKVISVVRERQIESQRLIKNPETQFDARIRESGNFSRSKLLLTWLLFGHPGFYSNGCRIWKTAGQVKMGEQLWKTNGINTFGGLVLSYKLHQGLCFKVDFL